MNAPTVVEVMDFPTWFTELAVLDGFSIFDDRDRFGDRLPVNHEDLGNVYYKYSTSESTSLYPWKYVESDEANKLDKKTGIERKESETGVMCDACELYGTRHKGTCEISFSKKMPKDSPAFIASLCLSDQRILRNMLWPYENLVKLYFPPDELDNTNVQKFVRIFTAWRNQTICNMKSAIESTAEFVQIYMPLAMTNAWCKAAISLLFGRFREIYFRAVDKNGDDASFERMEAPVASREYRICLPYI